MNVIKMVYISVYNFETDLDMHTAPLNQLFTYTHTHILEQCFKFKLILTAKE